MNANASSRWALDQRALNAAVVPGVVSVSLVNHVPLTPAGLNTSVDVDGANPATDSIGAGYLTVAPRYFETMGIPLVAGRDFTGATRVRSKVLERNPGGGVGSGWRRS
jgi:hypothetical protein